MTCTILLPSVFRSGMPNRVRLFSDRWLSAASFSYNGGGPIPASREGLQIWGADITPPQDVFTPATVDATATLLAGGAEVAPQVTVNPLMDLPLRGTGTVIPPAGSVTKWGDFGLSSGTVTSDGSSVLFGSSSAGGYRISSAVTLNPGHTIVTLVSIGVPIASGGRSATVTTPGCGLIQDITSSGGGRIQTQVFTSAGGYAGAVASPALTTPGNWHIYASNRDPATGLTRIYADGVLVASAVVAATQVPVSTPFYIAGLGDRYRWAGVYDRQLPAASLLQLQAELAHLLV